MNQNFDSLLVFRMINRNMLRGNSRWSIVLLIVGYNILSMFVLALVLAILGLLSFTIISTDRSVSAYQELLVPDYVSVFVAMVPVGLILGVMNVRALTNRLSQSGQGLKEFSSMSLLERKSSVGAKMTN